MTKRRSEASGARMLEAFDPKRVSVLISAYNREDLIGRTLESVWKQKYRPLEVIVIDDGSTDGTRHVLESRQKEYAGDPVFSLRWLTQPNQGCASARNRAVEMASGAFFQILDSDDTIVSDKISDQMNVFARQPILDVVYGQTHMIGADGKLCGIIGDRLDPNQPGLNIVQNLWHTSSPLYQRAPFLAAGPYREELRISVDWEHAARLKAETIKGCFLEHIVSHYHIHHGSQMVKMDTLPLLQSRLTAIRSVRSLLESDEPSFATARKYCSYQLLALALSCGANRHGSLMRESLSMCGAEVRLLAGILRVASHLLPAWCFRGVRCLYNLRSKIGAK